ncbi:hypothetical protein [Ideonella sp. YS5]|uniref:hypothetical protein n=1 Tax=Ideonella sp. YS5 TaxID=3453714 RepID=UPI003EEF6723
MAKLRDDAITASDVADYLATRDDFALELFVYSQARALGLQATHGGAYEDPVSKKTRQYDVRASLLKSNRRIDLAIECKSLRPSYPLLLSRIGRVEAESFHQFIYSRKPRTSNFAMGPLVPADVATVRGIESLYPPGEYVGKSTAQIGKNDRGDFVSADAEVYEKWTQALASASDLVINAVRHYKTSEQGVCITFVQPVLVVSDDTLWVADYSDEGVLQSDPRQIDQALLYVGQEYWKPMSVAYTASHLHICTKSAARSLLERVASDEAFWNRVFPHEAITRVIKGT